MLFTPFTKADFVFANDKKEKQEDSQSFHPVWAILIMEGFVVANSSWAADDPAGFGLALGLFAPIAGCESEYCVGLIAAESIALYNLTVDTNKTSKDEIFKNNIIAFHLLVGVSALTGYLIDEPDVKLSIFPIIDGAGLQFSYSF